MKEAKSNREQYRKDLKNDKQNNSRNNNLHKPSDKSDGFFAGLITKILGRSDKPQTVQDSIPYKHMYRDGICHVDGRLYTKTISFGDITYHLAQNDEKTQIFESYCDFLNYFDSTVRVQLSAINRYSDTAEILKSIQIPIHGDERIDPLCKEYSAILEHQHSKGNNGRVRTKYVTFGIEADSLKAAKLRLERVEADILNNFKVLGVTAQSLNGKERLELLHGQFHPDGKDKFNFDWKDLTLSGLSTKDFIAPTSFDFRDGRMFRMGGHYSAVSFLQILAPELNDRMLADFLDLDSALTVTLHIQSIDQAEAIKRIKRKLSDIEKMKIEEQMKANKQGYDMDILPPDLITYSTEAKTLLEDLQSRNERMFMVTVMVLNTAKSKSKLENDVFAASGIAQKYNCALCRLDWQQEQGLMSSLTLGLNQIEISRGLTTSSTAIFIPFTTYELFQTGEALYYGLNALSNNLIMANRKLLRNPNAIYLGTPGSGKSFSAKREIVNVFLLTKDDILISDPEGEYFPLVQRLGGQVVKLSPTSHHYINPLDITEDYGDGDDPLTLKSDFVLSFCELIIGGKDGLTPTEKTIIDRCTRRVYDNYFNDPCSENMPILGDLYELIRSQQEAEAQNIAAALELYVYGSLSVFNHHTNIDLKNRLICYDIKELGKQLKKLGMLILQDSVWNRVSSNRGSDKATWFYLDELHLLLKEEQTAAYTVEFWKRFRKWNGIPTGITQNVKDFLLSPECQNIFENSDFVYLLNQAAGDRQILAKQLGISPHQLSYVTHANEGEGLLIYNGMIIPFKDKFPKDGIPGINGGGKSEIYTLLTTKPSEVQTEVA